MQTMWVQRKFWKERRSMESLTVRLVMSAMHISTEQGKVREVAFKVSKDNES